MKKTLLSFLFAISFLAVSYSQLTSNVVVFSEDGNPFFIVVNGIKQNTEARTNIKITNLTNKANQIRVIFENTKIPNLDKSIYFDTMGVEATMKITSTKKNGYKLRYFGEIPLAQSTNDKNQWTNTFSSSEQNSLNNTGSSNSNTSTNTSTSSSTNTSTNNSNSNTVNSSGNSNQSTELNYNWISGSAHHFSAIQVDNISTSMMGMDVKEQIKTSTDFVLLIKDVSSNGYANGTLYLVNFKVTDSKQNILASINDLAKSSIQSEVNIDRKGHFTFLKKVFLITSASTNVLAYGNASDNTVQVGAQAGSMKVDAYAEFNPKTGALKTGYNVKEIKSTKKVDVKINEETQMIDVFPYDYLELLALPDGAMKQGDNMSVKSGLYTLNISATSIQNGVAQLNTTMSTDKSADLFDGGAKGKSGDGSINMNFENMIGSEDIEMTQEDKAAMGAVKSMSPNMSCNINSNFNYTQGMFQNVSGTVNTTLDAMGMKMTVQSVLEMKKM